MVTAKKRIAVVAAALFLTLSMVIGVAVTSQVHAEESATTQSSAETSETKDVSGTEAVASDSSEIELTKEEIPLAEAKATMLEAQTPQKGMPSIVGFALVAAAALAAGVIVAMRAKLGRTKRCYQPAKDLTIFKLKK